MNRPAHRDATLLALVWAGGTIGTLIRYLVETAIPPAAGGFPSATFLINVSGSFALGFLLEFLARRGPDSGRRRRIRLTLGTGVLGGYTTYTGPTRCGAPWVSWVTSTANVLYVV